MLVLVLQQSFLQLLKIRWNKNRKINTPYNEINLRKNIILLTDGQIENEEETLNLIKENNSKFRIFSFGIGYDFDEDLIKKSGKYGKGGYN